MSKHQQGYGKKSRVQNWLMQEGWQISEAQGENATWVLAAMNPGRPGVAAIQPQVPQDVLVLQSSIEMDQSAIQRMETLDSKERKELTWSIRLGLVQMGVEFVGVEDLPKKIVVTQRIYDDGLTKDSFVQRVMQVRNAMFFTTWTLAKFLEQPPPDDWPDSLNVH